MASPATFTLTSAWSGIVTHNTKMDFGKLYLRQIFAGSSMNQSKVVEPNAVTGLGETAVHNWGVYDGAGSGAELVAYAQGMHTFAGSWHNWFTMVFQLQRFKGSTLQIMGASLDKSNEWAIVGGTGDFAMANGVIQIAEYKLTGDETMHELTIDGYCRKKVPTPTKMGPWGAPGGSLREMPGKSLRLESVTLRHDNVIEKFWFSYVNEEGKTLTLGPWGNPTDLNKSQVTTIKFGPSEYVKAISGAVFNSKYISTFKIITNVATYGPFGTYSSTTTFDATVPSDKTVVGFFAYDVFDSITKIGLYTI